MRHNSFIVILLLLSGAISVGADQKGLRQTVSYMASLGSRMSGYPGGKKAADYVENQFNGFGFERVEREAFKLAVPIDRGGDLFVKAEGKHFELYGMWPNLVRTTTLPAEGVEAPMVYGGAGHYEDLSGLEMQGRVVLLEFNSWNNWLRAASLGARAIVFIEPEETTLAQADEKFSSAPLDVPRFWINRQDGLYLKELLGKDGRDVSMQARMDWREKTAWNIWAQIPGTDPELKEETIIVEAYFDGISVVPALAPAAEMASSIAGLLELAKYLRDQPPARSVILVATDAHFQGRRGISDFLERHARKQKYYAERMQEPLNPRLFISLDLSTQTDQLGLWNNTNSYDLKRFFVPFGRRFAQYNEELAPLLGRQPERSLVNGISPIRGMDWDTFVPGGVSVNSMGALSAGIVSLALVTVNDGRYKINTPHDTISAVNFDNLARQSELLNGLLSKAFNDRDLFSDLEDFGPVLKDNLRSLRTKVRVFPRRSQVPDRPLENAVVVIRPGAKPHKGVHQAHYHMTDAKGNIVIEGLRTGATSISAYFLDDVSGNIAYAPDLSGRAQKFHGTPIAGWILQSKVRWQMNEKTIVVFPTISEPFYSLIDPRYLGSLGEIKVMDQTGVAPRQFGLVRSWTDDEPVGVLFSPLDADEGMGLKLVVGGRMLLLNSEGSESEELARGKGYDLRHDRLTRTGMLILRDMWNLNEARLQTMREHAIENQRLTRLHESGRQYIEQAKIAEKELDWVAYVSNVRAALGVTSRAYPEVLQTLNDVIKGIVFFLALVIPSAFLGERLLFAAADVRRQLLGFFGLLSVVWIAIAQVHPAFAIAHPLVVLLAFAIMAMAALVLSMIISRFNRFMKEYQSRAAHVHETDISRASASYAAFMLGISNMRRRKVRTGLTLLTLVLLTFTVLSFTSFNAQVRYMAFTMAHEGAYEGVLIRDRNWSELNAPTYDYARSHFEGEGVVVPRNWYMAFDDEQKKYIEVENNGHVVRATGLLGLAPNENLVTNVNDALVSGEFFREDDGDVCLISSAMAEALGIDTTALESARVQVFGRELVVRGIFSAPAFEMVRDLDGEELTPADFQMSSTQALGPNTVDDMSMELSEGALDIKPFVHLEAENVMILPYQTLREAGGTLRSVAIRFDEEALGQDLVEDFLMRLAITLFAGLPSGDGSIGVYSYTSMGMTNIEGLGALVIPMFIAALIVLNAMMGAVYERFREIGIYSSVGLAPMHIALLFVAEAVVYAVIGVTLGYILGQGLGKILIYFDWLQGMNLNYSSWSAIVSSLLVMAVVLLSTLYPARVAARSAVPDTVRRWVPPMPVGDRWEFEFPFMVSEAEVEGLCGFLANYFNSYSEESIGEFYAEKVQVVRLDDASTGKEYAVQMLLWLAPFDMGVSQFLQLEFLPTLVKGVYTVEIYIERISGQDTFWQRVNHRFINGLRKEFLIWHTFDDDSKIYHRQTAATLLEESAVSKGVGSV